MNFKILLLGIFIMLNSLAYAEAPNGVSSNLQLWLKANAGISKTDGQSVTSWVDQSPNGYSAENTAGDGQTEPTFRNNSTDNINFNPVVEFDGITNGLDLGSNYIYSSNAGMTFFAVVKPDVDNDEGNYIYDFGTASTDGYGFTYANDAFKMYTAGDHGGVKSDYITHSNNTDAILYTGKIDFGNEQRVYLNGGSVVYSEAITLSQLTTNEIIEASTHHTDGQSGPVTIGRQSKKINSNDRLFDGKMAEIILYDEDLSDADRNKVQSYLAIKYGLTLDSSIDYVNSAGTTIYPSTTSYSTHISDIAAIGRDDANGLNQVKSRSVNSDSVVTIEGASVGDGNYLAWGNDDGALTFTGTDTPYGKRLERGWKTSEVGSIGLVTVSFNLSSITGADLINASKYTLLIDDDGDFSDATETSSGIISSNTISFSSVSLTGNPYFSLAYNNTTPVTGFGYALDFDGADDYVTANVATTATDNITLETWAYWTGNAGNPLILHNGNSASGYGLLIKSSLQRVDILCGGVGFINSDYIYPINEWHHFALVRNAGVWSLYVDGELRTLTSNCTPNSISDGGFSIAASHSNTQNFQGKIDEVRVWNTARTQTEIQNNMYSALTGSETGLASYWNFEEATGLTTNDLSTNANHGTLTNMDGSDWVTGIIGSPTFSTSLSTPINDTLPAYDPDGNTLTYTLVDDDGGAAVLTNVNTGAFTYTPHSAGTHTFSYKVNDGFADSNITTVTIEVSNVAPEPPTNFIVSSSTESSVNLSWTDGLYETSYILSRNSSVIATLSADTISYNDSSVLCGSTYNYSLKASNSHSDSAAVVVTAQTSNCPQPPQPTAPNEPLNFTAIATNNQIQLNWTDESAIETGYKILRNGQQIDILDENTESYLDDNLKCETTYQYEIYAYNSVGNSIIQSLEVITETCPPLTPGNLSATVTAETITLTWEDVEGETSYLVTREALTTRRLRNIVEFDLPADSTSFSDSDFECGQTYSYSVAATTDSGTLASASINVDAEPCAIPPIAPNQLIAQSITDNSISLQWSDNSDNESGFYIYQNGQLVKEVTENSQSSTIQNLECETTYNFQVTAYNAEGQANSETISVTTDICPIVDLVAPSNFAATNLTNNQIQLTWQDNSLNETGFPIARNGGFIAIAPINAQAFIDSNLECGTEYFYQLYATDSIINVGGLEQTISTPACPPEGNFYVHLNTIGSGIINNCDATSCSLTVAENETINLSATPSEGWQFSHWSGDCTNSQLLVDTEKSCTANFTQIIVEPELIPEPEPPIIINPLDPTIPTTASPVPYVGADLCGGSFTNYNSTTGNLNICPTGVVAGGELTGDNINEGIVASIELAENATITGGRMSGFSTNYGTLQDITITQYSEVTGGFYAGSVDNNGTMIDAYINEDSTIFSSTGQGSIMGIAQNKGTIQGTIRLGVNTFIIGGQISGKITAPYNSPAYLGDVEILPGAILQNVYLSPTVKLPRGVTLINVTQAYNPAEPDLDDFGFTVEQLDDLDARTIVAIEPAAMALFDRYEVASIPAEAFAGMTPEQMKAMQPETLEAITIEQFEQLPLETLAEVDNIAQLSPEVIESMTLEQLEVLNPELIKQSEQIAKLLTNLSPDTPAKLANKFLPQGWKISASGKIIPAVGSKLSFKGFSHRIINNVTKPYLIEFESSLSIGGKIIKTENGNGSTVGSGFNIGLQQTPEIDTVDLDQFIFIQNEYGIFNVVGTGDYEGIVFAFMPNANNIEQVPLDTPVGLNTIEGGYFEMITPDKQKFILINAPNNPEGLQQALGGESEIKLSPTGDVLMRIDTKNTRRNIRFETDVMMVGCFDAFVEPAPNACENEKLCDFGMELPADFSLSNLRARQQARVTYPDGTAQTIYPTVIYPNTLVDLLTQYEIITKALYKADGSFEVIANGQTYNLIPNFNVKVRRLEPEQKRKPKVNLQNNVLFYEIQEGDDLLTFSLNVEVK
jgi:hypothetical protein